MEGNMNKAEAIVTRRAIFSVGDEIRYYGKPVIVKDITKHYILIEAGGHKSRVDWLQLYSTQGVLFTVDVLINEL